MPCLADVINWIGMASRFKCKMYFKQDIVSWNAGLGCAKINDNSGSLTLNKYGPGLSDTLSIVGPPYFQTGYDNFSMSIV